MLEYFLLSRLSTNNMVIDSLIVLLLIPTITYLITFIKQDGTFIIKNYINNKYNKIIFTGWDNFINGLYSFDYPHPMIAICHYIIKNNLSNNIRQFNHERNKMFDIYDLNGSKINKDDNIQYIIDSAINIKLGDDIQDINKYSNNVMARQLLLTLALEKMGKPATTANGDLVIQDWLKQNDLNFAGLVIENGSGLSRNEAISAGQMNQLLLTARNLPAREVFYNSLPIAGADGTMRNRLMTQLRKFLHLKKKPEARIKTGSLADVRAISGYVLSKSGRLYAVSSFINHANAWKGLDAHDQLLSWLLEDGPEPKQAR